MRYIFSFALLLSLTTVFAQNQRCFLYDAGGNRFSRVAGTCSNPSALAEPDSDGQSTMEEVFQQKQRALAGQPVLDNSSGQPKSRSNVKGIIYPNPTSGVFSISLEELPTETAFLELYDAVGRLVERQILNTTKVEFNISDRGAGFYFLFLKSVNGESLHWKVVKE